MEGFTKVATTGDVPQGTTKSFRAGRERVLICNVDGEFYALADECTHDFSPIGTGTLDGQQVVCPRHGARFDVTNGEVKAPPAVVGIDTFEIKVENGDIFVNLYT